MFVAISIPNVNAAYVFFAPPKLNSVFPGKFYKISYSDRAFTMNGLAVNATMAPINTNYTSYRKDVMFDSSLRTNTELITDLCAIERAILEQYMQHIQSCRKCNYGIATQLQSGVMRLYVNKWTACTSVESNRTVLKISGVWDTGTQIGVTYKFIDATFISNEMI
jgi:hypothetical protein